MSDPTAPIGPSEREGVRTYRGRTIEELIPRIRAELGPDAIILREREGLTGGIGGFFAQRCVEIDARAAPRLSIYDDDDEFEDEDALEDEGEAYEYEESEYGEGEYAAGEYEDAEGGWTQDAEGGWPQDADEPALPTLRPELAPAEPASPSAFPSPEPTLAPPEPASPPALALPEPASPPALAPPASAPFLDEASFAARLEEATLDAEPPPEPAAAEAPEPPASPVAPTFIPFDELEFEPAQEAEEDDEPAAAAAYFEPPAEPEPIAPEPGLAVLEPVAPVAPAPAPLPPAPWLTFAEEELTPPAPTPPVQAPPATAAPAPTMPGPAISATHPVASPATAPPPSPVAPSATAPTPGSAQPSAPPRAAGPYGYGVRRRGGLLPAAERMLRAALDVASAANERRELEQRARLAAGPAPFSAPTAPSVASPSAVSPSAVSPSASSAASPSVEAPVTPPEQIERAQTHQRDGELEHRLVAAGLSASRAASLVGAAVSKRGPFSAEGELGDDVRAAIAAALPAPRGLPSQRGAVAVVGAGGSGKTRCVAAMAVARARAGGLVSVASLGVPGQEGELGALLQGEPVNVIPAMRTRATARAVASARDRGLVIIDTAAVTPRDGSTIDVIAEALRSFELDGIYLAVPATLSLGAGARLIDGFSAFDLVGLVATHADETDQLGVIAELSMLSGIPLAATHGGLDLQNAIAPADPDRIAAQLLT